MRANIALQYPMENGNSGWGPPWALGSFGPPGLLSGLSLGFLEIPHGIFFYERERASFLQLARFSLDQNLVEPLVNVQQHSYS